MKTNSQRPRILVTDDEKDFRQFLDTLLRLAGFEVVEAADGKAALQILRDEPPDAVLLDINMPGMNGMQVLHEVGKFESGPPIVVLTGFGNIHSAVEAMRAGAFDYLTKPFENELLIGVLRRAVELSGQRTCSENAPERGQPGGQVLRSAESVLMPFVPAPETVPACRTGLACRKGQDRPDKEAVQPRGVVESLATLMGSSDEIQKLSATVELVAPTNFTVVIIGETGAGKELVAKEIHRCSRRSSGPFMPVDCGSIPPTLIESELFGHVKGAFTGADRSQAGKFEEAAGGTVFLDEVQNLSLGVQTKLLRVLQERRICRLGSSHSIDLTVRILAATNEDLPSLIDAGHFRRDLYHRLNEFTITVPPLRARPTDLMYLANRFVDQACQELDKATSKLMEAAQNALLAHHWPGNVRELRNVIRRAVLVAGSRIHPEHLMIEGKAPANRLLPRVSEQGFTSMSLKAMVRQSTIKQEREILVLALQHTHGNHAEAARLLQIDYKTLRIKAKQYGIHPEK